MIRWRRAIGEVIVDSDDAFLTFSGGDGRRIWRSPSPFRVVHEDVPCQRGKVLDEVDYKILSVSEGARGLRLRLGIGGCFRIDMSLLEGDDGFAVKVHPETLVEICPNQFRVLELDLLPGFMGANLGEPGHFLLPNFCGGVIRFDERREFELRDMVYGDQKEYERYVTMPVCGMSSPLGSWLCVLTEGRFDARIVTRACGDEADCRFSLSPGFIIRHSKEDPIIQADREVRFVHFPGEADHNVMAKRYRKHLIRDRGFVPFSERIDDNPVLAYALDSYHCKIFHGMKFGRSYDGEEEMTVTTTFAETEAIARSMKEDGVEKCVFFLTGWNPGGHDGQWPTRFPIEEKLGGEAGWRKLKKTLAELDYRLSVHDNHVDSYKASKTFPELDLLTDRSGEPVGGSQWGGGATYRICPARMPSAKSLLDLERMKKLGVDGIYYLDNMPSPIFTCHDPRHPASRREYAMGIRRLAQSASDLFGCVSTESYQDYALDVVDLPWKVHTPLQEFCPYFDRVPGLSDLVPFFQVAYHGLRAYHAEYDYRYGQMNMDVEQAVALELALGAMPMNEVQERAEWYIPEWRPCRKAMAEHYRTVCAKHGDRQRVFIDAIHLDRDANRIETTYADSEVFRCDLSGSREDSKVGS